MSVHSLVTRALGLFALVMSLSAWSQPYEYHVYIDSDLRAATGCTVSGGGQTFAGADFRLTATVSGNPPIVTARTLTPCQGGSFGAGNTLSANYPVGLNNGLPLAGGNFADVIELSIARAQLPGVEPQLRIGFGAISASGSVDVLYTTTGVVGAPPMVVGAPAVIPTLGFVGALLLALALAGLALRTLKHNRRLAQMLLVGAFFSAGFAAWAANFLADGQVGDWAGASPVGMDAIGDSVPNLSATDIVGAFAADENRSLHFRIDVVDAENRPPVAVGDAYTTLEDTALNIAAPGVLGNDSDPDGNPITAQLVISPTRGTLVLNANGSFGYTPNANANGSDSFTYNAFDGQVTSLSPATVTIAITPVNDVPVFTKGADQTVLEDAGAQTINPWATGIDDGDPEVTQSLSFEITANSNTALFSAGPAVSPTGVLSYTPAANANGSATITLRIRDDGSSTPPNVNASATQTFTISVGAVNDAPTLTAVNPPTVNEDAGPQTVANWAAFNPGSADEAGQTVLGYQISAVSNAALFAVPPAVANNGTLTYTPAANANGSSTFVARVQDSGGTANGGVDLSIAQTFTITVSAINDVPSFTVGPNQTVLEDAGPQTVSPWATSINDGDPEVTQALAFTITANTNAALFSAAPSVSPTGVLSYTPAANANGSATITLRLQDDGSNTPPSVNTSATQTFTITVSPVNDAPSFVAGANQTVNEDAAAQTVNPWATAISAGPADESGQTLAFTVTGNTNAALFSVQPAISPTGVLTYTPAANASGVATLTLTLSDNGSNAPPNVNTSAAQTVTITVNAVNDAPMNTVPGAQTTGDGTPVVFSTANTNALSIADLDAAAGILQVSFGTGAAANGTLTLVNPGGALTTLIGNGTEQVIATGTLTALNAALNGPSGSLTYTPVTGTSAARTITMITNDQGNTGSGGAQIDTDTITVNVDSAPVVTSTPASGATIANNATIVLNFSEPVNVASLSTLTCGGPNLLIGATGTNVTSLALPYTAPLPSGTCTLTVPAAAVQDVDTIDPPNNPVGPYVATFTVDAAPAFVSSTPLAAAIVSTAQTVSFTYSEAVTDAGGAITLNCGGAIAGAVSGSGTATLTFTPTSPLPAGASCTATAVAAQINDADAFDPPQNPLANSTVAFSVDAAPAFVSATPAAAAVVGTGQAVSFTFDENVANLGAAITLNCGGAVAGAITGSGTPTLTFTPTSPLAAGASCTATAVAAQIGDSDTIDPPQNPVADVVRAFTVDAAPTVGATVPANGAINVGLATNLVVNFSEAVTFTDAAFTLNCPSGSQILFTVSGSGTNQATIDPTPATLPLNTLCVLTIDAAQLQDVDVADPPNVGAGITTVNFTTVNDNPPTVTASVPAPGATVANNQALSVTFSEAIVATVGSVTLTCGGPNLITGGTSGSNVTSLTPTYAAPLPSGACTLTVLAANITDFDAIDPPDQMVANYVASFTVDAAPSVTATNPANGATVAINTAFTANFSEPVDITSAADFQIQCPTGTPIGYTVTSPPILPASTSSVTIVPAAALPAGASCTFIVNGTIADSDLTDPPDTIGANFISTFTTDAAPAFVSSVPAANGAVVGTGQVVSFTFDENVANLGTAITLDCGGAVAGAITGSGTPTLTFTPTNPLTAGASCTATAVAAQIGDSDANDPPQNPAANVTRSFTVDTAPSVGTTVPADGAASVGIASNLIVNFSEAVTFPAGAFTLECPAGSAIPFTVSGSGTNQATIDPTPATLPINTLCVLTIDAAQLQDVDTADPPNVGAAITTVSFTTVNDSAPSVSSMEVEIGNVFTAVPLGPGLGSDSNTQIRLTFSETVNPTGVWGQLLCTISGSRTIGSGLLVTVLDPVFVLTPSVNLTAGDACTLTVFAAQVVDDDAIDPPDNMAANFVATFAVDAAPSVSTVVPANAATGVAVNATVTVNFSEPVTIGSAAAFSLECPAATPLGFTVTTPAVLPATASSFTVTPASNLPGSAVCVVTVFASEVSDADLADPPNTMLANFSSTFSTVDTAPSVTSTNPANGATSVNPTSPITINFSESVNFSTLANAANTSFDLECPGGTPANFTVATASPATSVVLNPDDNAIAGRTCALTVLASGVADADPIDPPDNMAANFNASFSFGAIANNDTYSVTPHLTLTVPTVGVQGGGTAANDLLGAGAVTGFGFAPACTGTAPGVQLDAGAANGRLTLNANGSFAYEPPAALAAVTRTFCYTVTGGDTANIDFTVENQARVWFVDAAAAGGGNGTQARPFNALTGAGSFNAVAADGDGDTIYIEGDHTGGLTLRAGQRMIGGGSTATIGSFSGVVPIAGSAFPAVSGSAPVITCSGVTCLVLNGSGAANTHSLRGFTVGDSGAAGTDIGGTNFGTLTVAEITLTGSGTTLNLATGTLNGTFLDLNTNAGNGSLTLSAVGGTWSVQDLVNITGVLIGAFSIADMPAGGSVTLTGGMNCASGNGSINLTNNASPINLGSVLLNTTTSMTVSGSTGVTTVTGGSLTTPVNTLLVTNSAVDITLSTLTSSGGAPGPNVSATNFTGSISIASGNMSNTQAGNTAVVLTNNAGTFSFGGQVAKNTAGRAIDISGGTGNVTFSGIVSCFTSCGTGAGNEGLRVTGRTGGTVAFSGGTKQFSSTATNPAVALTSNTGGTINFTGGGLAITTTSGTGFTATGGGTVTVQGAGNTVSTTTGTAVNVNATTIGAGGMTFESINSTAASANTAIVLNNTGAGAFSVTGTGAAGSGGTISNKTVDAVQLNTTGGLVSLDRMIIEDIGTMTGAIDTRSGHDAIQGLTVNGGLSLTGTTIRRISDQAIHGGTQGSPDTATVWNGLTLSGVTIENTNRYHVASTGDANNEGTVRILGIRGAVNVTNSTFSLGAQPLDLEVTGSTLNLTATGNTFDRSYKEFTSGVRASIGNHCIDVRVLAGATANVVIGDRANPALANNFLNCRLGSIRIVNQPGAGANTDAIIARNNFRVNDHSSGIGGNFDFPMGGTLVWNLGSGTMDTIVENNLFELVTNASGGVGQLSLIAEGGPVQALVQNNTFDRPGNAPWWVQSRGSAAAVMTARFVGNTVIRGAFPCTIDPACGGGYFGPGLRALADVQQGATLNFTMENNVMARHDTGFDPGQTVEVRSLNNGGGGTVCSSFSNNRSPDGYSLEQLAGTVRTVAAAGSCAAGSPSASCQSVFQNNGNQGGAGVLTTVPPLVNVLGTVTVNATACTVPTGTPF